MCDDFVLESRADIWPTDPAIVIRRRDEGIELVRLRIAREAGTARLPLLLLKEISLTFRARRRCFRALLAIPDLA